MSNNRYLTQSNFHTINSSSNYNRRSLIRRRLELNSRTRNTLENNVSQSSNCNSNINISSTQIYNNQTFRQSVSNLNSSVDFFHRSRGSGDGENSSTRYRRRNLNRNNKNNKNILVSVYTNKKNLGKKLTQIEEEQKKEEILKEENDNQDNLGSEIKDTVKCYICFDKITKPKMCPHCHRIACEKCLYNWFVNLNKKNCGFCRKSTNFSEMVAVPFMDIVVDFVDKFFNKNISE